MLVNVELVPPDPGLKVREPHRAELRAQPVLIYQPAVHELPAVLRLQARVHWHVLDARPVPGGLRFHVVIPLACYGFTSTLMALCLRPTKVANASLMSASGNS